jgi:hypothetical protein
VIGGRVLLKATQDPCMDFRLLDCGSWQALSSPRFPQLSGVFPWYLFGPGLLHTL